MAYVVSPFFNKEGVIQYASSRNLEAHKEIVDVLNAHNRRLTYTIIFLICVIFMIVATGIWFLNQYEYTTETVTVDSSDGVANYLGGDGSITNGNP